MIDIEQQRREFEKACKTMAYDLTPPNLAESQAGFSYSNKFTSCYWFGWLMHVRATEKKATGMTTEEIDAHIKAIDGDRGNSVVPQRLPREYYTKTSDDIMCFHADEGWAVLHCTEGFAEKNRPVGTELPAHLQGKSSPYVTADLHKIMPGSVETLTKELAAAKARIVDLQASLGILAEDGGWSND